MQNIKASKKIKDLPTKILVFGTFDGIHKGHINFFKQARKLVKNCYLMVSVARDINVKKIKGQKPKKNEKQRLKEILSIKLVDYATLGALRNYLTHIKKLNPKIIALGYDQQVYTNNLKEKLAKIGLFVKIIKLKPYKILKYKSSILKKQKSVV